MYGRRRRPIHVVRLIFLGTMAGIAFLLYEQLFASSEDNSLPALRPAITPTENDITVTPTPPDGQSSPLVDDYYAITDASIFIPAAGIYAPIIRVYLDGESWDVDNLGNNVGHLEGTAWMGGGPGNIVLSGHVELRDGTRGVFATIDELNPGDLIELRQGDERRRYAVTDIYTVEPDDLTPIYPTSVDRLTLITCDDYDFIRNIYTERVIVVAERIG